MQLSNNDITHEFKSMSHKPVNTVHYNPKIDKIIDKES